jgi:hypothetical protein
MKNILIGVLCISLAQFGAWFQQFAPIKWPWFKEHQWVSVILIGIPITYLFIWGAQHLYSEFSSAWSVRLIQFSIGMFVVTLLTYFILNEGINLKNGICLFLSTLIVLIQSFWK